MESSNARLKARLALEQAGADTGGRPSRLGELDKKVLAGVLLPISLWLAWRAFQPPAAFETPPASLAMSEPHEARVGQVVYFTGIVRNGSGRAVAKVVFQVDYPDKRQTEYVVVKNLGIGQGQGFKIPTALQDVPARRIVTPLSVTWR